MREMQNISIDNHTTTRVNAQNKTTGLRQEAPTFRIFLGCCAMMASSIQPSSVGSGPGRLFNVSFTSLSRPARKLWWKGHADGLAKAIALASLHVREKREVTKKIDDEKIRVKQDSDWSLIRSKAREKQRSTQLTKVSYL